MEKLIQIFTKIDSIVWGAPLLILLVGTGIYLTLRLGVIQIRKLPIAFKYLFSKQDEDSKGEGDVTSFQALCTALAATIGTGNIVGVATAIKAGGPGALFWMWMAAFFGMATKYAEGLLAVKYRVVDKNGQMSGGPMYYIERGLGSKWLAKMFAVFGIGVAFFGIGTFAQINAISDSLKDSYGVPVIVSGIIITLLVAMVTLGGIKSIAKVAEKIVPFMAILYILASLIILILNIKLVPGAVALILESAFKPSAAVGGFLGATVKQAIQNGVARGVFSNESGLGSAPIAAAAAKTKSCVRQGLISMTGTFIDTIVICTMTGITLILTGAWKSDLAGAAMTNSAFLNGIPLPIVGKLIITIGLMFFAFTTILGWNYYGERCTEYLFGVKGIKPYRYTFIAIVAVGGLAILKLDLIWIIADIVNGLMAIPNLIGLIGLSGIVVSETKKYFNNLNKNEDEIVEEVRKVAAR
ncbi:AGCS family alanine or glycine:cation symporter [Clostridium tetanomorphum]|uniref:Sodium:alanine symporter family protein n=2 Tax=Clostridium TaxID=1485 RepID=A0A923J1C5_CLOTT|nr:sodium:alanine symporter family protein [Clostridium tetanomorphum]KAJ50566.1 Na(+)-linked D-alanine glycine permease [Clostridium tetanomorphum DSM 665]MBC2399027.1 sodium:alanine symporter family protein [Clostridium tetanomorphum]MBP1862640.1 AGCS family alanine or glycine:cation symporter [Clostridium tetanomorphum]NRS85519.1 AGCS family alanine or glycine:cation symporter [Clostridium tetanomorphum]NRZ98633.1 AGCS family alanine or glycine:cation symporter [Clostridium tetanomorphum]